MASAFIPTLPPPLAGPFLGLASSSGKVLCRSSLVRLGFLLGLGIDRLDAAQQVEPKLQLRIFLLVGRDIGRASGLFLVGSALAVFVLPLASQVTAEIGLAARLLGLGLLLQLIRQIFLDHDLGLDALGLDRPTRRRVVARGR